MDEFESTHRDISKLLQGYILYHPLNITSCVSKVLYAADDMTGGIVRKMKNLPQFWIDLSEGKVFSQARCSKELINAAYEIFQLNAEELIEKIKKMQARCTKKDIDNCRNVAE